MCLFGYIAGYPAVITVPDDVSTIQGAILMAGTGDTVLVKPGIYHETIDFQGKQIVVGSLFLTSGDTAYIAQTIISSPSTAPVVIFENAEPEQTRLVGFTIRNGKGKQSGGGFFGGGIYCYYAHPSLEYLYIENNVTLGLGGCGGGIYFGGSHSVVSNCIIRNNEAGMGAGIRCDDSDVTIKNTCFRNNFAVSSGGGVMFYLCADSRIECCTFTGNAGIYGGAICCNNSNPVIDRVTCYHNSGGYGGTLNLEASQPKLLNSILWDNSMDPEVINEIFIGLGMNWLMVAYCDILGSDTCIHGPGAGGVHWMEGNIELFPEFTDTTMLDLTLQQQSPCVNAGISLYVYNGDTLVDIGSYYGAAPDMGSCEFPEAVNTDPAVKADDLLQFRVLEGDACTIISLELFQSNPVAVSILDLQGRTVEFVAQGLFSAGLHRFEWNNERLSSGLYIIRVTAGQQCSSKKVLVR